jgi:hypothetical protein
MHIVAIASSFAASINVLLTLSVHEISDRRKDGIDFLFGKNSSIDIFLCIFRIFLISIFDIDISN